jgi:hypothetical protein
MGEVGGLDLLGEVLRPLEGSFLGSGNAPFFIPWWSRQVKI